MDVGGQRGKGRRWKLSGAPVANIQAYGGQGWRGRRRDFVRGLSGVDLPRGVRGRARETCAIFHHYADTMVGLAGSYVLLFLLALLPTSPLIFLSSLFVRRAVFALDPLAHESHAYACPLAFTSVRRLFLSFCFLSYYTHVYLKYFYYLSILFISSLSRYACSFFLIRLKYRTFIKTQCSQA